MDRNLPAAPDAAHADLDERPPVSASRPLSVAFLPLALAIFVILALAIAAWTFLAAAG